MRWKLPWLTSQLRQTESYSGFQHIVGSKEMNKQTGLLVEEANWTKRTGTPLTLKKRRSSNPSPRNNGSSNTQTTQTASTNWTDQSRLFCSDWEVGTTDLMPIYIASSGWWGWDVPMPSTHPDNRTSTTALPTTWCSEADMWPEPILWDKLYGNLEELRRTAVLVRATGISLLCMTKKKYGDCSPKVCPIKSIDAGDMMLKGPLNCMDIWEASWPNVFLSYWRCVP